MRNGFLISPTRSALRRVHYSTLDDSNKNILSFVQRGQYSEALHLYSRRTCSNSHTSRFIFPSLVKGCTLLHDFRYGEVLHSSVIKLGFHSDPYIVNSLIRLYIKSGSLSRASKLFDNESSVVFLRDTALWNSIIDGYFKIGSLEEAMAHFSQMLLLNVKPDAYTLCILLGICKAFPNNLCGKDIHGFAMRNYCDDDSFVVTALIDMYCGYTRLADARNIFEKLQNKYYYVEVWNSMISGFCSNGLWIRGLELLIRAKRTGHYLGSASFASLLAASSQDEDMRIVSQLHCDVVKMGCENDPYVYTSLVTAYSECGYLEGARRIVCLDEHKEVEVWNATISAYVNQGYANDALDIYASMRHRDIMPDSFTYSSALIACSMTGSFSTGIMIHAELCKRFLEDGNIIQSALQAMYSKLGKTKEARNIFTEIQEKDVIAWGSMISGSLENLEFNGALILFQKMLLVDVEPDSNILANALNCCSNLGISLLGFSIHGFAIKAGSNLHAVTGNALIEFYSRCGQPEMARRSFSSVLLKNLAVWNSLMSCYSLNGMPDIALLLLPQILQDVSSLDCITITIALSSVSQMALLPAGKAIHGYYIRSQLPQELQVENSLLDMYIKSGFFKYAQLIFSRMPSRDVVTWNSMISGYGSHGECHKAMELFLEMKSSGYAPDSITFSSLISSCNHSGFIDEGIALFNSMKDHGIEPNMDHYLNMADLLCRGGHLREAFVLIQGMATSSTATPNSRIWMSLLSGSRVHRNADIGDMAAKRLIEMDSGNYAQVMNFYVEVGVREKAAELRGVMRKMGMKKLPGCSWIQVKDTVEVFFSGGFDGRISDSLHCLENCMKMTGDTGHEELVW